MALKEILVHLNQSRASGLRLRLAMELAKRHASHLSALFVEEWNSNQLEARATAELGLAGASDLMILDRSVGSEIGAIAYKLRKSLESFKATRGIAADWHQSSGFSDFLLSQEAPYTDITVIGHGAAAYGATGSRSHCENLLCETGGPLILVPEEVHSEGLGRRVVIAWDASPPATRTLGLALPIIEKSEHTTILNITGGAIKLTKTELYRLAERLNRHGTSTNVVQIDAPPGRISELLQSHADALGADLIACGAFGHGRLKEDPFGGVTCDLMRHSHTPLFIAR